jgi:hypothetical protein
MTANFPLLTAELGWRRPDRDFDPLRPRAHLELLRVRRANVQVGDHRRADRVDRADAHGRAAPAVSARCVEADAKHLDLGDGRLNRSMREDGAHVSSHYEFFSGR